MSLIISNNNKLDIFINTSKQNSLSLINTSPNSMILSILHIVWLWLRPILPKPLLYFRRSKKPHGILKLVQLIKKQEEMHIRFCHNYTLVAFNSEDYANHINTYIYPTLIYKHSFYYYINDSKCYKKMSENENHKYTILNIKRKFIVTVLGRLLECCYGAKDNIL